MSYILGNKIRLFKVIFSILIITCAIIFSENNYFLYKEPIGKIEKVTYGIKGKDEIKSKKNKSDKDKIKSTKDKNKNKSDKHYQNLTIKIKNTGYKGKVLNIQNTYEKSEFRNHSYNKGEKVFLEIKKDNNYLSGKIRGVKRDNAFIFLGAVTIALLIMISTKRSIFIILSTILNVFIFLYGIKFIAKEENIYLIAIILSIIIIILSMIFLSGFTKKSFSAMASTIVSVLFVIGLYEVLSYISNDLSYEFVQFTNGNEDIASLYKVSLIFTILGAVMDVSVTVNSAVSEIIKTTDNITVKKLIPSIREIGDDINGTMINVVFFTFILGELPLIILKLYNGYAVSTLLRYGTEFEIIRFLIGAIGIVLTIPISAFFSIIFNRKELFR